MPLADMAKEEQAYHLLQWGTPAPLAEFDEALAVDGFYTRAQQERSNTALAAFDKDEEKARPLTELQAFRQLVAWGVFTNRDYFSPEKADNSVYSYEHKFQQHQRQLRKFNGVAKSVESITPTRQQSNNEVPRRGVAASDEESGSKPEFGVRRQGRRTNRSARPSQQDGQ